MGAFTSRRLVAALLTVMLAVPAAPAAVAATEPGATYPRLGAVNVLSGDRASFVRVTVPEPARLLDDSLHPDARSITATGRGRFIGFALVAGEGDALAGEFALVGGRLPRSSGVESVAMQVGGGEDIGGDIDIPAGSYRLYLLADGPATVTIRLRGLEGTSRFEPRSPARYRLRSPTATVDTEGVKFVYANGTGGHVAGSVLHLNAMWAHYPIAHTETVLNHCYYFGEPVSPTAYGPGCTGLMNAMWIPFVINFVTPTGLTILQYGGFSGQPSGYYGHGASFVSTSPADRAGYLQLWLSV